MTTLCEDAPVMKYGVSARKITLDNYVGPLHISFSEPRAGSGTVLGGSSVQSGLRSLGPVISVSAKESVILQLQNAFDNTLNITPFGDRPGTMDVTVLGVKAPECQSDGSYVDDTPVNLETLRYYERYRYADGGPPITITIGDDYVLDSVLAGVTMSFDGQSRLPTFVLTFAIWHGNDDD